MDEYYTKQAGSGIGFYSGSRYQKGHGFFGRLLSGTVMPFLKYLGKQALGTGKSVLGDVLTGTDLKSSAKRRLSGTVQKMSDDAITKINQYGNGVKRKNPYQECLDKCEKAYKAPHKKRNMSENSLRNLIPFRKGGPIKRRVTRKKAKKLKRKPAAKRKIVKKTTKKKSILKKPGKKGKKKTVKKVTFEEDYDFL